MKKDLKAGPELDHKIAVEILGWKPFKKKRWYKGDSFYLDRFLDKENREIDYDCPGFSTDVTEVCIVVNELKNQYDFFALTFNHGFPNKQWGIQLGTYKYESLADTPTTAICIGALKAQNEEILGEI